MSTFEEKLWENYQKGRFTDVEIRIGDYTYKCHKVILSIPGSYFYSLFSDSFEDSTEKTIEINLIDKYNQFPCIIKYLYLGDTSFIDSSNALIILYFSVYLTLKDLENRCIDYINNEMKDAKADLLINQILSTKIFNLQDKYIECISSNLYNIENEELLYCLPFRHFLALVESYELKIKKEFDLLRYIINYIKYAEEHETPLTEDDKSSLKDVIQWEAIQSSEYDQIDYTPLMSTEEKRVHVKNTGKILCGINYNPIIKVALSQPTIEMKKTLLSRYVPSIVKFFDDDIIADPSKCGVIIERLNAKHTLNIANNAFIVKFSQLYYGHIFGYTIEFESVKEADIVTLVFVQTKGRDVISENQINSPDKKVSEQVLYNNTLNTLRVIVNGSDRMLAKIKSFRISGFYFMK